VRRGSPLLVCAAAVVLSHALAAGPARAQDRAGAVDVTVAGTADDLERVRALVPRLAGGGARWLRIDRFDPADVLRAPRDGQTPAVRAWVDMTVATRARLAFATRAGDRFLIRDVQLSGHFDEVDRAALAEVLESSVGALLGNEDAGMARADAEAALADEGAPPPLPRKVGPVSTLSWAEELPVPRPRRRALGVFYGAQALGGGAGLQHGPGVSYALAPWRKYRDAHGTGRGPIVFATAQYRLPVHEDTSRVGVALDGFALRAGVECGPLLWSRLRVRLAAGADVVRVAPESSDPTVALAPHHWTAGLVATAALRVNVLGNTHTGLSVALVADVLPTAVRYELAVDGAATPVFSPWRVRPGATLEVAFF
jgi:hypothetical protein